MSAFAWSALPQGQWRAGPRASLVSPLSPQQAPAPVHTTGPPVAPARAGQGTEGHSPQTRPTGTEGQAVPECRVGARGQEHLRL